MGEGAAHLNTGSAELTKSCWGVIARRGPTLAGRGWHAEYDRPAVDREAEHTGDVADEMDCGIHDLFLNPGTTFGGTGFSGLSGDRL